MADLSPVSLPVAQLRQLDFLLGEGSGVETRYSPEADPVYFKAYVSGSRESCDRFIRVDYFANIPGYGTESYRCLITYSEELAAFRCWSFSTMSDEPASYTGSIEDGSLVLFGSPTQMPGGLQKLRLSFTPLATGGYFFLAERWELEGWTKHCSVTFLPPS